MGAAHSSTPLASRPHVVIIGGGYAGLSIALALQDHLRVTLLDPRRTFYHILGATRALASEGFERSLFIPRDRALQHCTLLAGSATRVDPAARVVFYTVTPGEAAPGEPAPSPASPSAAGQVSYDYLVIATGATYSAPGVSVGGTTADNVRAFVDVRAAIAAAQRIVCVGGGSVGAEVCGEIAGAHGGGKSITLVHSGAHLISEAASNGALAADSSIGEATASRLRALGVTLRLGERVTSRPGGEAGSCRLVSPGVWAGATTLSTSVGAALPADLVIWAAGGARAATGFLRDSPGLAPALDARTGELLVDAHLRVKGWEGTIFGAGDCAGSGHPKMALVIERGTAPVVAANVLAYARAAAAGAAGAAGAGAVQAPPPPSLKVAAPWTKPSVIVILTPSVGFGKLGPLWLPDAVVCGIKGKDKLLSRYLARLKYESKELEAK